MEGKESFELKRNVKIGSIYTFVASLSIFAERLLRSCGKNENRKITYFCRLQKTVNGFHQIFVHKKASITANHFLFWICRHTSFPIQSWIPDKTMKEILRRCLLHFRVLCHVRNIIMTFSIFHWKMLFYSWDCSWVF